MLALTSEKRRERAVQKAIRLLDFLGIKHHQNPNYPELERAHKRLAELGLVKRCPAVMAAHAKPFCLIDNSMRYRHGAAHPDQLMRELKRVSAKRFSTLQEQLTKFLRTKAEENETIKMMRVLSYYQNEMYNSLRSDEYTEKETMEAIYLCEMIDDLNLRYRNEVEPVMQKFLFLSVR